jgi:uncharacterized protein with ParB-like and HNH nuclease domain/DNA-binding PadR family transcriptional regulator
MVRITENELILPSLYLMMLSETKGLTTTDLIAKLRDWLKPSGEDLEILAGRSDDKFSQKVRNLKSHRTFERYGYAKYEGNIVTITEKGEKYLEENMNKLKDLFEHEKIDIEDSVFTITEKGEKYLEENMNKLKDLFEHEKIDIEKSIEAKGFFVDNKTMESDKNIKEELTADGHLSGVEAELDEIEKEEPFDPEQISIDSKPVMMDALIRRLLQGTIRLAPAFQRNEVWNLERKSRLIESLMLKIPLPMFYVAADEKGNWDVVDGLQRLTTLKEFILGRDFFTTRDEKKRGEGFKLQQLEFWGDKYNDFKFNELPELMINRILETEFKFTIINPGTPEEVKRNIFKRINTGGMPLTSQEIRHALYQGKSTEFLKNLVKNEDFKKAIDDSVDDSRMAARELILRFLAFSIRSHTDYPKTSDMDAFLSDTMRIINIMPELHSQELHKIFKDSEIPTLYFTEIESLEERFTEGMKRAYILFGENAFRKSLGSDRRSPINKTLFEVWGNILADLKEDEFNLILLNKSKFLKEYHDKLTNPKFINIIRDCLKYSSVQTRYKELKEIIHRVIKT